MSSDYLFPREVSPVENVTEDATRKLRHVIIGVGAGVLSMHRPALELETVDLVGVSDINAEVGRQRADELRCKFYEDYRAMLAETRPDVAVILTPHPFHAAIAIDCLEAGCHVLVEKPMAVQVAEADAMIAAAERAGCLIAENFQHRHRPDVKAARRLIGEGELGRLLHLDMTASWPRTAIYYKQVSWRGTWAGEGGGVLMNQAPHNLDLICYLLGMPKRVVAWTRTILHRIETEDTVQAMLEWPSGTLGSLHISTAEAGRPERLEIVGTGGYLQLGRGTCTFNKCEVDFTVHMAESNHPYASPALQEVPVQVEEGAGNHLAVYQNLHEAILEGASLLTDGYAGRMSLELTNAMIYSSYTRSEVKLPLDREKYRALLEDLKAGRQRR